MQNFWKSLICCHWCVHDPSNKNASKVNDLLAKTTHYPSLFQTKTSSECIVIQFNFKTFHYNILLKEFHLRSSLGSTVEHSDDWHFRLPSKQLNYKSVEKSFHQTRIFSWLVRLNSTNLRSFLRRSFLRRENGRGAKVKRTPESWLNVFDN